MTKTAKAAAPAPVADNAASTAPERSVVTQMGAPKATATAAPAPPADPLDKLGTGASLEEVAAALGLDPNAQHETESEPQPSTEDPAPAPEAEAVAEETEPAADGWNDPLVPERPEYIPAKFKNLQDFAKSYTHLEKKMSGAKGGLKVEAAKPGEAAPASVEPLSESDLVAFAEEFAANESLSEATYERLAKAGISKAVADRYVSLELESRNRQAETLLSKVGLDHATFQQIGAWATENLPANEVKTLNAMLASRDPVQEELAVQRLKTAYEGATRAARPRAAGRSNAGTSVRPLTSKVEIAEAVGDPRYGSDTEYTEEINRRIELGTR